MFRIDFTEIYFSNQKHPPNNMNKNMLCYSGMKIGNKNLEDLERRILTNGKN